LVAVSKTKPAESIQELYNAGYRCFGENYFQELVDKAQTLPKDIQWHFIGHLQSSKAAKLVKEVPNLAVLETVDTVKLAGKLNNACEATGRAPLSVFIQVDTSGEATKSGVDGGEELQELLRFIRDKCPLLRVTGLMTIGELAHSTVTYVW
jgi:pyridoxal phosphate enzyme (YggS family)